MINLFQKWAVQFKAFVAGCIWEHPVSASASGTADGQTVCETAEPPDHVCHESCANAEATPPKQADDCDGDCCPSCGDPDCGGECEDEWDEEDEWDDDEYWDEDEDEDWDEEDDEF